MVRMVVAQLGLDRATNTPVVILREDQGERTLPIWIGQTEAEAIGRELRGERPERPMTHDLLKQLLVGLGGNLQRVSITSLRDNTYLAELLIHRADQFFEVDARPSDSIALALRVNAPIYASDELLKSGSSVGIEEPPSTPADNLKQFLSKLDPQDLGRFNP